LSTSKGQANWAKWSEFICKHNGISKCHKSFTNFFLPYFLCYKAHKWYHSWYKATHYLKLTMDSQNSNQRLQCAMKINVGNVLNIQPCNRLDVNNLQSFCKWCINHRELKAMERTYRRSMSTESLHESNISRVAFGMPASPPNHASNTQNWNPCDNFHQTNHETWKGMDCIVFDKWKHQSSRVLDLTTFIFWVI
jgi:hypothetical protein